MLPYPLTTIRAETKSFTYMYSSMILSVQETKQKATCRSTVFCFLFFFSNLRARQIQSNIPLNSLNVQCID